MDIGPLFMFQACLALLSSSSDYVGVHLNIYWIMLQLEMRRRAIKEFNYQIKSEGQKNWVEARTLFIGQKSLC